MDFFNKLTVFLVFWFAAITLFMQNILTVNSNKGWDRIMIMRKFFENNLHLTFFFSKIEGQGGVGTEMGGRGG